MKSTEAFALEACLTGDDDEAAALIRGMLPNERVALRAAALRLAALAAGDSSLLGCLPGESQLERKRTAAQRELEVATARRDSIKRKLDGGSGHAAAEELAEAEAALCDAQAYLAALPAGA
jgi:hypothetical protein